MQSALRHQGQQPQGLEADGLAAGVGPGDDQRVEFLPQLDGDRHRPAGIQQRMPGVAEADASIPPDLRPGGVHLVAQLSPGEDEVATAAR